MKQNQIVIYQDINNAIQLEVRMDGEVVVAKFANTTRHCVME